MTPYRPNIYSNLIPKQLAQDDMLFQDNSLKVNGRPIDWNLDIPAWALNPIEISRENGKEIFKFNNQTYETYALAILAKAEWRKLNE